MDVLILCFVFCFLCFFFFKQKTAYEMRISDWSSDVCSSDLFEFLNPDEARCSPSALAANPCRMRRIDTEAVDQRIGQRHWRAAHRHFIEEPLLGLGKAEQAHGLPALRLGQLPLAEQRAHHEHRRHAAKPIGSASCRESMCTYV